MPTTTSHYIELYTFTNLTTAKFPVKAKGGLKSLFIPILAQANQKSVALRSNVERKTLGPSSFFVELQTFLQHGHHRARQRWKISNTRIRSMLTFSLYRGSGGENGQKRLTFFIKQIWKNNHIENISNPPNLSFVESWFA